MARLKKAAKIEHYKYEGRICTTGRKPPKPATRAERRVLKAALEWLAAGIYRHDDADGGLLSAVYALRRSITKETDEQILESFPLPPAYKGKRQ